MAADVVQRCFFGHVRVVARDHVWLRVDVVEGLAVICGWVVEV